MDRATEVIAELGFIRASIARSAERVGVAKSGVLYHFATKDDLGAATVERLMAGGAQVMVPALLAEQSAAGKLAAYIRANCAYLDTHRTESVAMFEILTSFRTSDGLRLDQAAARSVAAEAPARTSRRERAHHRIGTTRVALSEDERGGAPRRRGHHAAGLRAGVPAIPVPGIMDQPYWSTRLVDPGVAPGFGPRRDLDAEWLADAVRTTTTQPRTAVAPPSPRSGNRWTPE